MGHLVLGWNQRRVVVLGYVLLLFTAGACASPPASPTPMAAAGKLTGQATATAGPTKQTTSAPAPQSPLGDASGAESAIRQTYEALASKDRNAYIDSIDPSVRNAPSAGAVLSLATQLLTGAKIDFEDVSFRDMKYTVAQSDGTWALVRYGLQS